MANSPKSASSFMRPQYTTMLAMVLVLLACLRYYDIGPLQNAYRTIMWSDASSDSMHQPRFCDAQVLEHGETCVFDIGLNTGQDTQYYLKTPSTRVVAVEANPHLVADAMTRFANEVEQNRLKILGVGLVGSSATLGASNESSPMLDFYVNTQNDRFSSFSQRLGCRSPQNKVLEDGNMTYCTKIQIGTRSCDQLVREFGTPMYMKIDIEGMDHACLRSLTNLSFEQRPRYVSKEDLSEDGLKLLVALGYTKFKIVNQASLQGGLKGDDTGHSGPWGNNATDIWLGREWHSEQDVMARLPELIESKRGQDWYDVHASQ